jgi:uncharacterized OB-fold protein
MITKREQRRRRETIAARCEGKEQFYTYRAAERRARNMRRRNDGAIVAYACRSCGRFHVGNARSGL